MDMTLKAQPKHRRNSWKGRSKMFICGLISVLMILSASVAWAGCGKEPKPSSPGYDLWCRCKGGMTYQDESGKLDCKPIGYSEDSDKNVTSSPAQMTAQENEQQPKGGK